jgi:hypothetical protein
MRRLTLIILGAGFLLAGFILLAASVLKTGINDGEWTVISKTGSFSKPSELIWSPWQANDGSITSFRHFHPKEEPRVITEFRSGRVSGFLFDFTVYEGRLVPGDKTSTVPTIGPGWGASYRSVPAKSALAVGMIFFISSCFTRRRYSDKTASGLPPAHKEP